MTRVLTVQDAGPLTTVQDRGRPGWAHLGVPRSGALDRAALDLGNRMVGNDIEAAGLETTSGGVTLQVSAAMTVAVTGAVADVLVDDRPVAWCEPVSLRAGQSLRVGPARHGLRCYVAVGGGLATETVLGSRSTDTLSGLGPVPVAAGDVLAVGPAHGLPRGVDVPVVPGPADTLRCTPGPREDWFDPTAMDTLTQASYTVSTESNRVALRLEGTPLGRLCEDELPSEGLVLGAVQVPSSGQPLVFLNDHPVTGGYPVIGVVEPADLGRCAQLRPGDQIRFRV